MAKKAKVPLNVLVVEGTRTMVKYLAEVLECSQGEVIDRAIVLLAANENVAKGLAGVSLPVMHTKELAVSPFHREPDSGSDPSSIPGVSVGAAAMKTGFPCRCVHSGCRGAIFTGLSRLLTICPECSASGHGGDPRDCKECENDSATGAL